MRMKFDAQRVLWLAGPTAAGKSAVALELALRHDGEIVAADSMQVYRGMDLGTAKPTPEERARVPHHLLDVAEVTEPFDVRRYRALAEAALADVLSRGRLPIVCGGTGLYFKALLRGLDPLPALDAAQRAELEATPLAELRAELRAVDPASAARVDLNNPRRVQRAVELARVLGPGWAERRRAWQPDAPGPRVLGLRRTREDLRARIEARVDRMFADGLVAETRRLLARGLAENRTALQALGYRQVAAHLRGEGTLAEAVAQVKQRTWQFARRQMTWFRHQLPMEWVDVPPGEPPAATAERVWAAWRAGTAVAADAEVAR